MLEYEWGNPAILLTAEEMNQEADHTRQMFNQYTSNDQTLVGNIRSQNFPHNLNCQQIQTSLQGQPLIESQNYGLSQHYPSPASLSSTSDHGISSGNQFLVDMSSKGLFHDDFVKSEVDFPARIGLNLGGRTYFSSDDDFVNRLYRRNRLISLGLNSPRCQAEGCIADLSHAKHYHRRHKVCEFHSKASTVIAAGLTQRFCQQCSRFHLLTEFDQGKRSCRKRLADHNRRRRKPQPQNPQSALQEIQNPQNSGTGDPAKSSSESGSSLPEPTDAVSVTVAVSPPQMSLHYPCQSLWPSSQTSSSSTSPAIDFPSPGNFRSYIGPIPGSEWDEEQ